MSELNQACQGRVAEWLNAPVLGDAKLRPVETNLRLLQVMSELKPAELLQRRVGRAVECTGLENQRTRKGIGGSNPSPSATA